MLQQPPVIPNYETPVLEPFLDPEATDPFRQRFNTSYYQFFDLLLKSVLSVSSAPVIGTSKAGAITLDGSNGIVTTEPLATAAGGAYTLVLLNGQIESSSNLLVTVSNGSNTGGAALLTDVALFDGAAHIRIENIGASAFNGSLQVNFLIR